MADFNTNNPVVIEHKVDVSKIEEKQVKSILALRGMEEGFYVKKIQENVFASGWDNTERFSDKNGKTIMSLYGLRGYGSSNKMEIEFKKLFQAVSWQAGYREELDKKSGKYILYTIKGQKEQIVPKDTIEYFQAWQDIKFHYERGQIVTMGIGGNGNDEDRKKVVENIEYIAKDGHLRIRDLIFLASPKMGYLKQSDFQALLPVVRSHLLSQIGDPRWERTLDPARKQSGYTITKEELSQYLSLSLIDRSLYDQAIKKGAEVEKLKRQKQSDGQGVLDDTRKKTAEINR